MRMNLMSDEGIFASRVLLELQHIRTGVSEIRGDVQGLRGEIQEVRGEIQEVRTELHDVRLDVQELRQSVAELRAKAFQYIIAVDTDLDGFRKRLEKIERRLS
jgi:uncharacterized coiled-coil DUF342 family protein